MKILLPTDFSDTAASALRYGEFLAKRLDFELEVVHAHDGYGHSEDPTVRKGDLTTKMNVQHQLDEFLRLNSTQATANKATKTEPLLKIKTREVTGSPVDTILKLSDDGDTALIVMGGVGSGKVSSNTPMFGSVAKSIALNAKVPVLLIPQGHDQPSLEKVSITFNDFKPLQETSDKADFLIDAFKPKMRLVHVEHHDDDRESLKKMNLLKASLKTGFPDYSVDLDVLPPANLAESLLAYIAEFDLDLLVMGHRKRGLFSRLFLRSGVAPVLDISPIPILVVPISNY
ncbi:universal stress protein [Neolewinella persica]|uniref:universal stress protein n=1 Tax=Neolewinella persica TaxID=70998 RepID=UPI0003814AE9|nr:universal stress protein [Neolewinella persica]